MGQYSESLPSRSDARRCSPLFIRLTTAIILALGTYTLIGFSPDWNESAHVPLNAPYIRQTCEGLRRPVVPPSQFLSRSESDRFVVGTPPTLIRNATIWTGRFDGHEVVSGDILLDKGIINGLGGIEQAVIDSYSNLIVIDAKGAWVTPGIVDMHSHLGVESVPLLRGSTDVNSLKGLILPWLRSLDGLNTHDEAYRLSISGGVTTANILPGSADAIGGQAFTIKLRPTVERSSSAMVLEPPHSLNGSALDPSLPPRWRQMKHACGENPSRVYSGTRMDNIWAFRQAYDTARKIKDKQDAYCSKALSGEWKDLGDYPEDLQWEALVDVLRGRVKIHNHCYEAVDLDGMVRLTNEFKFPIAAFHHAHETYLVPDLLKKAYGGPPAIALFATNARYKREAYRGSEFAPAILADNDLKVVMKSDHPVLNSRHLIYEAQQAHYYGLSSNLALASVTSTPAKVLGYDHRIGFLKKGYDADLVIWDSNPLFLGATPKQVFIDGIAQLNNPQIVKKPGKTQKVPKVPNFEQEAIDAIRYDGLPPLEMTRSRSSIVAFHHVSAVYLRRGNKIEQVFSASTVDQHGVVVTERGKILCYGLKAECSFAAYGTNLQHIDLKGGSISPALISYGAPLALNHIDQEVSANDGSVLNLISSEPPRILGQGNVIRAVDGLQFATRDALLAYRAGVTAGITAPLTDGFLAGLGTAFGTGLPHRLATGALLQDVTALHFDLRSSQPSVSTHIAALRHLFLGQLNGELSVQIKAVIDGKLPLVIQVHSADTMATLIELKKEIEIKHDTKIRLTFSGAAESHLLAKEIAMAGVGVIVIPSRPFPETWKSRRILPGPPLTQETAVGLLLAHNVTLGIGIQEQWSARNTRFDLGWISLDMSGSISTCEVLALASVNLEHLLGLHSPLTDLVAVEGGSILDFEGKVVGIISQLRGVVDLNYP